MRLLALAVVAVVFVGCDSTISGNDGGTGGGTGAGTATGGGTGGASGGGTGGASGGGTTGGGGATGGSGATGGGATGGGATGGGATGGGSGACGVPAPFDVGITYARTLHVSTTGSASGDGSMANPFDTIPRAVQAATPGTRILVAAGQYPALNLGALQGSAGMPIAISGVGDVRIDGSSGVGISMSDGAYVVLEHLRIVNSMIHGMNLDDASSFDSPSHHLVLRDLTIASAGTGGNNDCIKLSGVDDFWVVDSDVSGCNAGEIIDMVGCHRGVIANNDFHDTVGNGVQAKGGSSDTLITGNLFRTMPQRAVNAGGSTGLAFFRPQNADAEARNIRVIANTFVNIGGMGGAAVAYVGCDACVASNNTIISPRNWIVRILQENTDPRFVPSRNGVFINNLIVLNAADISTVANVGANTSPMTFTFGNNLWFALDRPGTWMPPISGVPAEMGSLVQQDPLLVDRMAGNYHLQATSPARTAGRAIPGGPYADFDGTCFASPPAIGAFAP